MGQGYVVIDQSLFDEGRLVPWDKVRKDGGEMTDHYFGNDFVGKI